MPKRLSSPPFLAPPSTLLLRDNKDNTFRIIDLCENIKIGRGKKTINNNNNNNNAQTQIWDNNIMSKQHAIIGELNGKVKAHRIRYYSWSRLMAAIYSLH